MKQKKQKAKPKKLEPVAEPDQPEMTNMRAILLARHVYNQKPFATKTYVAMSTGLPFMFIKDNWNMITDGREAEPKIEAVIEKELQQLETEVIEEAKVFDEWRYQKTIFESWWFWIVLLGSLVVCVVLAASCTTAKPCGSYDRWEAKTKFNK